MAYPFKNNKKNFATLEALTARKEQTITVPSGAAGWWKKAWIRGKRILESAPELRDTRALLFETLEPRVLLSAELSYLDNGNTETALTLTFFDDLSPSNQDQYRLLDGVNIVDIAAAAGATDGGVVITGTDGNDILRLNLDSLGFDSLSSLTLTFLGGGDDRLVAAGDVDFTLSDSSLTAGTETFALVESDPGTPSFEDAALTGGASTNTFTLNGWSGSFSVDGGGGGDTLAADPRADGRPNEWQITGADAGTLNSGSFTDIENLFGSTSDDAFVFQTGGSLGGQIDGGTGDDAVIGPDSINAWTITATAAGSGTVNGVPFVSIENLIGGNLDDTFVFSDGATIVGSIDGGHDNADTPSVDTLDYSAYSTGVSVNLAAATATGVGSFTGIESIKGGSASDTLFGPEEPNVPWTIDGADSGNVVGVVFGSFENLNGAADNVDVFIFGANGSLSGVADGGAAGTDGLIVYEDADSGVAVNPSGPDDAATITIFSRTISYVGIDGQEFLDDGDPFNLVLAGTVFDDTIRLFADGSNQKLQFEGLGFLDPVTFTVTDTITLGPAQVTALQSLRIEGRDGHDTVTVESLAPGWAASLLIYGSRLPAVITLPPVPEDDQFIDRVTFSGDINTGGFVDVWADRITVDDNVHMVASDINLRARLVGLAQLENLIPLYGTHRLTSVDIGAGAQLTASGSIYAFAESLDSSIADAAGVFKEVDNFVVQPLADKVGSLLALPVKLLEKFSTATITMGAGSKLMGAGTVGLYATTKADASGNASGSLFSIGYAQAAAESRIDIATGALIDAGEAAVVAASAEATAKLSSSTERALDSTQNPGTQQVALSLAASFADVTSKVSVAQGAFIRGGKTANVKADGATKSEATAESGIFADGKAGLAFGLEFSKADVTTTVDGTVIALADPETGYTVKIEIDPTVGLNPDGTPKVGYVDYANDRIYVGSHALVTEDAITYSNRRGTSIGGLVDGRKYIIITEEPGWIKFAESSAQALRASVGFETSNIVDLQDHSGTPIATANNSAEFAADDVDAGADTIALHRPDLFADPVFNPVFNTFELGQAVVYQAGPDGPIPGLVDGGTYYVIATTAQDNLQGDTRLVDTQVIRLAETENESRAGVVIDLGAAPGDGHSFSAKHVLDSGFATGVGVTARHEAEDKASASAGLKSEDQSPPGKFKTLKDKIPGNLPDMLFQKLTKDYRDQAGKPKAGASGSVSVAGALAFMFADHDVTTDVLGHAVLKSNEDLEVKATIAQKYNVSAESNTEPQEGADGSSAPNNVSVAVSVSGIDNDAITTVHDGAGLDALRATRVIADVSYPFLQRFDTFIPLSWGELTDAIREQGPAAVTKYLNTNLGLKDAFFNTWTAATAEADQIGVAASVSVLVFFNDAQAIVQGDVLINQDEDWRNPTLNPHPNQNNEAGADADGSEHEQTVSVEATNYQQTINMTGIFSLPELSLDVIDNNDPNAKLLNKYKEKKELSLNPLGTGGKRGGAGGAIFIGVQENKTHAIVEDGAEIYSGADGGFNMKAEEALLNVNLAQSAAKGGTLVIGGTVLYTGQTSDTLVRLGSAATVTGRNARLYAGDLTTHANWAGGIAVGESIGAGISVSVNNISRQTRALIGEEDATAGSVVGTTPTITVTGGVQTLARVQGDVWAFGVAGTVVKEPPPDKPDDPTDDATATDDPEDPLDGVSLPALFGEMTPEQEEATREQGAKTGVAIAAAASVNLIEDETRAAIADAGQIQAGFLSVDAENSVNLVAATGGLAFAKVSSGSTAVSLAGAFSFNQLMADTTAEIQDTALALSGNGATDETLRIRASTSGSIIAAAAGGAGSVAAGSGGGSDGGSGGSGSTAVSIAGSASVNLINGDTSVAFLHSTALLADGDARIVAEDRSSIFAIAGGLSLGIAIGDQGSSTAVSVGAAVAVNRIGTSVSSLIEGAQIGWAPGAEGELTVEAVTDRHILAATLGGAVSVASGTQGEGIAGAGAGSGSVNLLDGDTRGGPAFEHGGGAG
jgi:hypothetical protein